MNPNKVLEIAFQWAQRRAEKASTMNGHYREAFNEARQEMNHLGSLLHNLQHIHSIQNATNFKELDTSSEFDCHVNTQYLLDKLLAWSGRGLSGEYSCMISGTGANEDKFCTKQPSRLLRRYEKQTQQQTPIAWQ